jgi:hypothetical protein
MNRPTLWVLAALLALSGVAYADDTALVVYGGGESYQMVTDPSIRLENEVLEIGLYPDHFSVTASLYLHNTGPAKDVLIGFPQLQQGEPQPAPGQTHVIAEISNFRTETDGQVQATTEKVVHIPVLAATQQRYGRFISKLFTRVVSFASDGRRMLVDRYDSDYDRWGPWDFFARYLLGTAGSWGGIQTLKVVVTNWTDKLVFVGTPYFADGASATDVAGAAYQTQGALGRTYEINLKDLKPDLAATFEIRLDTDIGGYWDSGLQFKYQIYPQICFDLMTSEDLAKARNLIYAFHGYVFKSARWKDYFSKFDWYKPDVNFTERKLNDNEAANVRTIRAVEASRKTVSAAEPATSSTGEP